VARADVASTTQLFQILSITLAIWAVQGIYARAFYAASDTRTPAITGTVITVLSIPMYWALFRARGLTGLAIASDIGIFVQTATLAILLQRKRLVSLHHLEFGELGRALLGAFIAYIAAAGLVHALPVIRGHKGDLLTITAGTIAWTIAALIILVITRSKLPAQIFRRKAR
jgi:putative peptidoglycan lipid II flippase